MKSKLVLPIIAGAAVAATLTYLFTTEEGAELRGKLSDNLNKGLDNLKEKYPEAGEHLVAFKDKFMENLSGFTSKATDEFEEVVS